MLAKIKRTLTDKKGGSHVMTAVICLALAFIFAIVFIFARSASDIRHTKDTIDQCLDDFTISLTTNTTFLRKYMRHGNAAVVTVSQTPFVNDLTTRLGLVQQNGMLYSYDGEKERYHITVPVITFSEDTMPNAAGERPLKFTATFIMYTPMRFPLNTTDTPVMAHVELKVHAYFRGISSNTRTETTTVTSP